MVFKRAVLLAARVLVAFWGDVGEVSHRLPCLKCAVAGDVENSKGRAYLGHGGQWVAVVFFFSFGLPSTRRDWVLPACLRAMAERCRADGGLGQ